MFCCGIMNNMRLLWLVSQPAGQAETTRKTLVPPPVGRRFVTAFYLFTRGRECVSGAGATELAVCFDVFSPLGRLPYD